MLMRVRADVNSGNGAPGLVDRRRGRKARFYADTQAAEPGAKMAAPPRCAGFTSISKDYFEMIRKVGRVSGGVM